MDINKRIIKIGVLFLIIVGLVFFLLNFKLIIVRGDSMWPTLKHGEIVIARKIPCSIEINDTIVFSINDVTYIKRVKAMEGAIIKQDDIKGILYINNTEAVRYKGNSNGSVQEFIIPKMHYFVVGDNYNDSVDSRSERIGLIPYEKIEAVILNFSRIFDRIS